MDQAKLFLSSLEGVQKPDPGDPIFQSLRFRAGNTGLGPYELTCPVVTPGLRNWTWSGWVKTNAYSMQTLFTPTKNVSPTSTSSGLWIGGNLWYQTEATNQADAWRSYGQLRDPSAWYHIVFTCDVDNNETRGYINGAEAGDVNVVDNQFYTFDTTMGFTTGASSSGNYAQGDFYVAEVYMIDGQVLDPTVFGRYNAYDVWVPVKPQGLSFGDNGFYLDFSDPNDVGADRSPNGNNFTANGFNTVDPNTSEYDWSVDTPTQNYAAWNNVSGSATSEVNFYDVNLRVGSASTNPDTNFNPAYSTFGPFEVGKPGKYYFEMYDDTATGYKTCNFGVTNTYNSNPTTFWWSTGDTLSWYPESGNFYRNNTPTSVGPASTTGNKGMAIDFENGTVTGYDYENDNTWDFTGLTSNLVFGEKYYIVAGTSQTSPGNSDPSTMPFNFGQQPFRYSVPDGFVAMQTQNLPKAPFFNGRDHFQAEASDEIPPAVSTPVTDVSYVAQRNWSVDNNIYLSGVVGWNDSANGYDENQITGAVINKALNESALGGNKQTISIPTVSNNTHVTVTFDPPLANIDGTFSGGCDYSCGSLTGIAIPTWNGVQFQISHTQIVNQSAAELSSFGIGVIPWTAPYSASLSWLITLKNAQGTSDNIFIDDEYTLTFADAEDIEEFAVGGTVHKQGDTSVIGTITAINGNVITLASNSTWQTGDVLVLERFQVLDYMETVFPEGLYWVKGIDYGNQHQLMDSVRGDNLALTLPSKGKQQNYSYNGGQNVAWCWKLDEDRANGFDILSYQGDGQTSKVIPHNLDPTKPLDMVIVKGYNAPDTSDYINDANWMFWHKDMPANGYAYLQNPGPFSTNDGFWTANGLNNTLGSLTVGGDPDVNNGQDQRGGAIMYIAYLWQAVDTFSAFGSYPGNGDVDGPFIQTNFRPAFVLIKSSTTTDSWLIYDSTRQKQNPMNLVLEADNTAAEKSYTSGPNDIDFLSNGFKCRGTNGNMNGGGTYVWAAFAENPFQHPVTAR